MKIKKVIIVISLIIIFIITLIGLAKINIVNSKTLSPLINNYEEYNIEEKELYESYSDFIKDETLLKIYNKKNGDILVRVGEKDYVIKDNLTFKQVIKNIFSKIGELF